MIDILITLYLVIISYITCIVRMMSMLYDRYPYYSIPGHYIIYYLYSTDDVSVI